MTPANILLEMKELALLAKEINGLQTASASQPDRYNANDERLKLSLHMAEAKAKCEAVGLSFKEWCEAQNFGYHNARKLARIGAEGEDKARVLLEGYRKRTAEATKRYRERESLTIAKAAFDKLAAEDKIKLFHYAAKILTSPDV